MSRKKRTAQPLSLVQKLFRGIFEMGLDCNNCGERIELFENYCEHCGAKNSEFDPLVFFYDFGVSLKEFVSKECKEGHPEIKEDFKKFGVGEEDVERQFCDACGHNVVRKFLQERRSQ
ncbi:MAG TPA: hypothetical protein VJB92_00810 [Candidatus Paceibacterota bacterium]